MKISEPSPFGPPESYMFSSNRRVFSTRARTDWLWSALSSSEGHGGQCPSGELLCCNRRRWQRGRRSCIVFRCPGSKPESRFGPRRHPWWLFQGDQGIIPLRGVGSGLPLRSEFPCIGCDSAEWSQAFVCRRRDRDMQGLVFLGDRSPFLNAMQDMRRREDMAWRHHNPGGERREASFLFMPAAKCDPALHPYPADPPERNGPRVLHSHPVIVRTDDAFLFLRSGCKFSGVQTLRAAALEDAKSSRQVWCGQKNGWPAGVARRTECA
jgi:hypothetical protein